MQRYQNRRVGHSHTVFDERFKRTIPIGAEVDVVMRCIRRRHTLDSCYPQQTTGAVFSVTGRSRGVNATQQGAIRNGQVGVAHHSITRDAFAVFELDTGYITA